MTIKLIDILSENIESQLIKEQRFVRFPSPVGPAEIKSGSGVYNAPRGGDRRHKGIDLVVPSNTPIKSRQGQNGLAFLPSMGCGNRHPPMLLHTCITSRIGLPSVLEMMDRPANIGKIVFFLFRAPDWCLHANTERR